MEAKKLIQSFGTTHWLVNKQAEGLSHEDSLLQLPFRSNTFNWVVGHLVMHRDKVLAVLGQPPVFTAEETELYARGSEPIMATTAVSFSRLLEAFNEAQTRIVAALQTSTPEDLAAVYNAERQLTVADRVSGLHWHETYHVGQLEILRQLAGTDDVVIA